MTHPGQCPSHEEQEGLVQAALVDPAIQPRREARKQPVLCGRPVCGHLAAQEVDVYRSCHAVHYDAACRRRVVMKASGIWPY